jgi:hypothetical protein
MVHTKLYGKNLLETLPDLVETPEQRARLITALAVAVKNDARIVVNRLSELPEEWVREICEIVADWSSQ